MKQVYVLVNIEPSINNVSVYASELRAQKAFKDTLKRYKSQGCDININAKNDSELLEATNNLCQLFIVRTIVN